MSFLTSLVALSDLLFLPAEEGVGKVEVLYQWVSAANFKLDLAILVDPLSVFMFLIVTGVGFVIHVYSIGYMQDDPEYSRFFSYLNLFTFFMIFESLFTCRYDVDTTALKPTTSA